MRLNFRIRNFFGGIFVVVFIAVFAVMMVKAPRPDHIEDTNGPDNHALQQITEEDVLLREMGARGGIAEQEKKLKLGIFSLGSGVEYSSNKFTGVALMDSCTLFAGSDIHVYLEDFEIKSGNFAFFVIFEGEIVGQLQPDEFGSAEFIMKNVPETGVLEYVIAGESASFSFVSPSLMEAY